ncbi:MAG: ABC transporter permease [Acidobacteriota bacterium]
MTRTSFSWFVARRYLTARRRQTFISLISLVSILGVGVGVMALIIALALMTGVQGELRDRIVGATAHVIVFPHDFTFDRVEAERQRVMVPGVAGAAPAIVGPSMMQAGHGQAQFAMLKGIDPALEPTVTDLRTAMVTGSVEALSNRPEDARDGVLLGADLAKTLGVQVGDQVDVVTPESTSTPIGLVPKRRVLDVVGTFQFGFYEVDTQYALIGLRQAGELLGRDGPDMLQLRVTRLDDAVAIRKQLEQRLGADQVTDWTQLNKSLYSALWLEKLAITLTIGLIVVVAALNIVASLILLVMEKTRDIAILRTMGAPARVVRRIFVLQGLTIGLIGTLGGTVLGLLVCYLADRYRVIKMPSDVYQISYLPFHVEPADVAVVVVSAIVVCLIATIYPSRQASRIDPAEALRNQ